MATKLAPLFSRASDEWATPGDLWEELDAEFHFDLDAAATSRNARRCCSLARLTSATSTSCSATSTVER